MYGLSLVGVTGGADFTMIDTFLFSSIIIAVDPVAVGNPTLPLTLLQFIH